MGILDGLFSNYQFDPRTYSDAGGWLGPIAGGPVPFNQTQPPQGFPAVASPSIASPPQAQSGTAPAPMAGSAIGRAADQPSAFPSLFGGVGNSISSGIAGLFGLAGPGAPQGPSLLDRFTAGANNLTTGGNPIAGLVNAVNGLATGQRTDRAGLDLAQQQATMQALVNSGVDPIVAHAAAINPDYLKAIVAARYGTAPTAQVPSTAPRTGANRIAGNQPASRTPAGITAMSPARPGPTLPSGNQQSRPLPRVATPTEASRLPRGTHFLDPQGVERVVP